jgi:hypothetical protein
LFIAYVSYLNTEYRCNTQANLEVELRSCKKFYKKSLGVAKMVGGTMAGGVNIVGAKGLRRHIHELEFAYKAHAYW